MLWRRLHLKPASKKWWIFWLAPTRQSWLASIVRVIRIRIPCEGCPSFRKVRSHFFMVVFFKVVSEEAVERMRWNDLARLRLLLIPFPSNCCRSSLYVNIMFTALDTIQRTTLVSHNMSVLRCRRSLLLTNAQSTGRIVWSDDIHRLTHVWQFCSSVAGFHPPRDMCWQTESVQVHTPTTRHCFRPCLDVT